MQNNFVPSCKKQIAEAEMKVPICILGDSAYPLVLLTKEYPKGGKNEREQYFSYRLSSACIIENAFGRLKERFGC